MNTDEFTTFEDRVYVNPTLSSGEQEEFISNLRDVQSQGNAQIAQQTYNLGTDIPSNLGGLGGGESYFMSRYQTPQVDEMISTLETAVKAQELQDLMNNYKAQLNNRYKQAYRNYQRRQRARSRSSGGSTTPAPSTSTTKGNVVTRSTEETLGLNVGRDELASRNLDHETIFDRVNKLIETRQKTMPTKEESQQKLREANEKLFGNALTQFKVGR